MLKRLESLKRTLIQIVLYFEENAFVRNSTEGTNTLRDTFKGYRTLADNAHTFEEVGYVIFTVYESALRSSFWPKTNLKDKAAITLSHTLSTAAVMYQKGWLSRVPWEEDI